jgi:hypothetical protein
LKILLRPNTKKGITKSSTSLTPAIVVEIVTVENTLRPNTRKESKRAAHHSTPAS